VKLSRLALVMLTCLPLHAFAAPAEQAGRSLSMSHLLLLGFAGALVFFMQAGFALLESGMARAKNAVNVLMKNYLDLCFGAVAFWAVGYALMFGANPSGWIGGSHFFFNGSNPSDFAFFFYQVMFAATTATIVSGAIAERTHFGPYIFGSMIITAVIYPVFGAWAWGGWHGGEGWLARIGFVDFAGSTVVHSIGGWCALAALLVVKPRIGRFGPDGTPRVIPGHNLSAATLGAFILWLGWFGFNAGSVALLPSGSEGLLGRVLVNTHLGGAGGALGAVLAAFVFRNRVLLTVTLNGSIAGLVSVTAGCHVMDPLFALLAGVIAGFICSIAEAMLVLVRVDDVVGAVAVHLVGGVWGTIAAGLFNADALFTWVALKPQLIGVATAGLWAFPTAFLLYKVLDKAVRMRATPIQEQRGLDFSEHAEVGYPEFQQEMVNSGKVR
jgi:ammonium transporter, Amt family